MLTHNKWKFWAAAAQAHALHATCARSQSLHQAYRCGKVAGIRCKHIGAQRSPLSIAQMNCANTSSNARTIVKDSMACKHIVSGCNDGDTARGTASDETEMYIKKHLTPPPSAPTWEWRRRTECCWSGLRGLHREDACERDSVDAAQTKQRQPRRAARLHRLPCGGARQPSYRRPRP